MQLRGKTIFITGASRGIGRAIALRLASEGANIAIIAKSVEEDPRLGGTVFSVAKEANEVGGKALAIPCDIRDEEQVIRAVQQATSIFGGIDVLINNASAITLTGTQQTETKRFDLMHSINVRGTFLVTRHCIPYLKMGNNPHIITLSPPLNIQPKWLAPYPAYAITKYSMTMLTLGWAEELKDAGVAANALWPKTTIATAAVKNLLGGDALIQRSRKPDIIADAVYHMLLQPANTCTGNTFIDEEVLAQAGITDLSPYAINPSMELYKDLFLD